MDYRRSDMDDGEDDDDDDLEKQLELIKAKERALIEKLRIKKLNSSPKGKERIEVPTTPPRKIVRIENEKARSPARIRLNIDKGLRAKDVSLRAPGKKKVAREAQNVGGGGGGGGGQLTFAERLRMFKELDSRKNSFEKDRLDSFSTISNVGLNDNNKDKSNAVFEKYSQFNLSKQYLEDEVLDEEFADKKVFGLDELFATVHPPDFISPNIANFVVIGIIASRSDVRVNRMKKKYMMVTLTDFRHEIRLSLSGDAFDTFWKIREGTVIAILNPEHYVYKVSQDDDSKTFALSVNSSSDVILELGRSADLGICPAIRKNGNQCFQWIDSSKTKYCDYHLELGVHRAANSRMEFNSAPSKIFSPKKNGGRKTKYHRFTRDPDGSGSGDYTADPFERGRDEFNNRVYTRGNFFDERSYDRAVKPKSDEATKRLEKKLRDKEIENKLIRKQLAERPNGHLLRDYDERGHLIGEDPSKANSDLPSNDHRLFTPQQIRRIGFDPTQKLYAAEQKRDVQIGSKLKASEVNLSRPKRALEDSSDDDLEIV